MATTFHLTIATTENRRIAAEQTLVECHRLIEKCEAELTEYRPTSPVYQLNHREGSCDVAVGDLARELFLIAETLRRETHGAFHFGAKGSREIDPPFALDGNRIRKLDPNGWLGFGAIGKGFTLDKVRELVEREGFLDYCLNAGGSSILLSGMSAPETPWSWAWSWAKSETGTPLGLEFQHETGKPVAIGVSGTQEKGAHLIATSEHKDETDIQSALIAASSATESDALSTALFVGGWEAFHALPVLKDRELIAASIDVDGVPRWNGRFQRWWGALASFACLVLLPISAHAEEAIDLGDLGIEQFNPYMFERDPLWALLPFAALLLVVLHLKRPPKPKKNQEIQR